MKLKLGVVNLYIFRITVVFCYLMEPMSPLSDVLNLRKRVDCCNMHPWQHLIVYAFPKTFWHLLF